MDQLRLPADPSGIEEPHDVLAADEFAMPAGPDSFGQKLRSGGTPNLLVALVAAAIAAVVIAALRRR
jgi:hypothetical protein